MISSTPVYKSRSPVKQKKDLKRTSIRIDAKFSGDNSSPISLLYRKDAIFYPFISNRFDLYMQRRLQRQEEKVILDRDYDNISPLGLFQIFSSCTQSSDFGSYEIRFENFLNKNVSGQSWISMHKPDELLIFLAYVSNFPEQVVTLLISRGIYNSCVAGLLSLLTEHKDNAMLASSIACLAFIVERHSSVASILTLPNISQLIKLCLSRAIYPTGTELEAAVARLALSRLMQIDLVQQSASAAKELTDFVGKWWQRLRVSVECPGQAGSFDIPDVALEPSAVPALRRALEISSDIFERFPAISIPKTSSIYDAENYNFLGRYIYCNDVHAILAAARILNLITTKDMLDCSELAAIVARRIDQLVSKALPDYEVSFPIVSTPTGDPAPRKRSVTSATRQPFCDVTNTGHSGTKKASYIDDSLSFHKSVQPPGIDSTSCPVMTSDRLCDCIAEYLTAELFNLLHSLLKRAADKLCCSIADCSKMKEQISSAATYLLEAIVRLEPCGSSGVLVAPVIMQGFASAVRCLRTLRSSENFTYELKLRQVKRILETYCDKIP